ncbi:MAG: hypothetical protein LKJ47_00565 [Bifidobacteriaceae bacterium]|jgi:hypothetical protein|nr:hypothetical protein [Bifidobacteriaceae bacterium]
MITLFSTLDLPAPRTASLGLGGNAVTSQLVSCSCATVCASITESLPHRAHIGSARIDTVERLTHRSKALDWTGKAATHYRTELDALAQILADITDDLRALSASAAF